MLLMFAFGGGFQFARHVCQEREGKVNAKGHFYSSKKNDNDNDNESSTAQYDSNILNYKEG